MNRFSRIRHHVSVKDVKETHHRQIADENFKKVETEIVKEISERFKNNWRKELSEGMSTGNMYVNTLPAEGETAIDQLPPTDAASFADVNNMFGAGADSSALDGTTVRANGTGSGDNGGFNVGGEYLAFQGTGTGASRFALMKPLDATKIDTLTITAIRGNSSNGGEEADIAGQEELFVIYKTPDMTRSSYLSQDRNQNNIGAFPADAAIIAIGQGNGTLQDYTITIPEYARQKDTVFGLFQLSHSGAGFDHYGITDIKFQRKTPLNVVVPLDDPEAISFIRVGTNEGDPKKRKKKVNDQLAASDEYTSKQLGDQFPGQGARLGDDTSAPDPFSSAPIQEPDASPIGKGEVTKSFANFSTAAADAATTEPEPEPTTPSTQTTMNPTNDDGEEINVKPVGGRNSGAVQGADAANLDAQNAQDDAQEPEPTEPEPTEPEPELDPEELKASEQEKQNKTPEEVEKIEREKYEAEEQKQINKILDKLLDFAKQIDPLDNTIDGAIDIALGIVRLGKGINQIRSFLKKISGGRFGSGRGLLIDPDEALASGRMQKFVNNIEIMRSNLTGRITTHDYDSRQISDLAKSLTVSQFMGDNFYGEFGGNYGISDVRHEYVDDNIYVKDGKVYTNDQGLKSLANMETGVRSIDGIGKGYGQMIIPKDGSKPYFHFYDYNYHNLNSSSPTELPDDFITKLGAATAQVLRSFLPGRLFDDAINLIQGNLNTFGRNLKTRVGLDGWPPGIHGATLTDFKIPLDQLPEETQKMIALHPLSWTEQRVAKMSDQYLSEQFDILLGKEGYSVDDAESYFQGIIKIMNSRNINIDPEFKKSFIGSLEIYDEMEEVEVKRQEVVNSSEYSLATDKAFEDYNNLFKDKDFAISDNELRKAVPEPEGEYPDYTELVQNDPDVVKYNDLLRKSLQSSIDYYNDVLEPAFDKYQSYADTLKKEGNKYVGTDQEIAKLKKLEKPIIAAQKEYKRIGSETDNYNDLAIKSYEVATKKYDEKVSPWDEAEKKRQDLKNELRDFYNELMDEAYLKYEDTFVVRKGQDGKLINGGDYTDPSGKTYAGKETLTNPFDLEIEELVKKEEQYVETVSKFGFRYLFGTLSKYLVNKNYKGKTTNWSPKKKGTGDRRDDDRSQFGPGGDFTGGDATAAATAAAETRRRRRRRVNESNLFERLKSKPFFNPNDIKPTFPEKPPGKIDPKTRMHQNYGKQAGRYKRLDPISANAMPKTGDPEIDAMVDKQRTKKRPAERRKDYIKTFDKIKKIKRKG